MQARACAAQDDDCSIVHDRHGTTSYGGKSQQSYKPPGMLCFDPVSNGKPKHCQGKGVGQSTAHVERQVELHGCHNNKRFGICAPQLSSDCLMHAAHCQPAYCALQGHDCMASRHRTSGGEGPTCLCKTCLMLAFADCIYDSGR